MPITPMPGLNEAVFENPQPAVVGTPALLGQPWPPPAVNATAQTWAVVERDVFQTAGVAGQSLWNIANRRRWA